MRKRKTEFEYAVVALHSARTGRENAAKKVAAARKKLEAAEREYKQARLALERSESMFTKVITYLTHHAR